MADDIKMIALWQICRPAELYGSGKYYPRKHTSLENELVRALKIKSTQWKYWTESRAPTQIPMSRKVSAYSNRHS